MTKQIDELMRMIHAYKYNGETYARVKAALEAVLGQPQAVPMSALKPGEPVGYLPAYEVSRLRSGHDANLRSARFGPSNLDGDIPVYTAAPPAQTPPPRLTAEQINLCWHTARNKADQVNELMLFARAIETAVRKQFGINDFGVNDE